MFKVKYSAQGYRGPAEVEVVQVAEGVPLLDHVEPVGMKLPYGCRAGSCGICRVEILEGSEHFEARGFVEEDTADRCGDGPSIRLACQAKLKASCAGTIVLAKAAEIK
jgi:ferredoxin